MSKPISTVLDVLQGIATERVGAARERLEREVRRQRITPSEKRRALAFARGLIVAGDVIADLLSDDSSPKEVRRGRNK